MLGKGCFCGGVLIEIVESRKDLFQKTLMQVRPLISSRGAWRHVRVWLRAASVATLIKTFWPRLRTSFITCILG